MGLMATKKDNTDMVKAWQQRLDSDFPGGLSIVEYPEGSSSEANEPSKGVPHTVAVSGVEVLEMATPFSPVVRWEIPMGMTTKDVVQTIDTYSVEEEEPTKIVRVTCSDGATYRFSDNLTDFTKQSLAEEEW